METNWKADVDQKDKKNDTKDEPKVSVVKSDSNHIYFYSDVDHQTCLDLNKHLQDKTDELLCLALKNDFNRPRLYLHINSYGGYIFSAVSTMDTILRLRKLIDIITIVEGAVASSGTLISVCGTERWMTPNSYMLIHQLSSGLYGKYRELKDDMKNSDELMKMIKKTYFRYTAVPEEEIDKILDHDLWWDAETCRQYKIVDKIV